MVGNLTKKIKKVKCPGVSPGGGRAWAPLELTHTLVLISNLLIAYKTGSNSKYFGEKEPV